MQVNEQQIFIFRGELFAPVIGLHIHDLKCLQSSTRWQRLAGCLKKRYRVRSRPPCATNSSENKPSETKIQRPPS